MHKKSMMLMAVGAMGLCGAFFGAQYFLKMADVTGEDKHALEIQDEPPVNANNQAQLDDKKDMARPSLGHAPPLSSPPPQVPPPSPAVEKLNAVQKQIEALSDMEVIKQADDLKAHIYSSNLIDRLNNNQVTEKERQDANDLLAKLALFGIEKAKRGLLKLKPEIENTLKKHDEDIAAMKEQLKE